MASWSLTVRGSLPSPGSTTRLPPPAVLTVEGVLARDKWNRTFIGNICMGEIGPGDGGGVVGGYDRYGYN